MHTSQTIKQIILLSITMLITLPCFSAIYMSESMADNDKTLMDADGDAPDWIELYNDSSSETNLEGWYLSDSATNLTQWTFPSVTVPARGFLIVFASDKDRSIAGAELHTNFKLSASGESIVLVHPDGTTIESQLMFPSQQEDISFGYAFSGEDQIDLSETGMLQIPTPGSANSAISYLGYCGIPLVHPARFL